MIKKLYPFIVLSFLPRYPIEPLNVPSSGVKFQKTIPSLKKEKTIKHRIKQNNIKVKQFIHYRGR